MTKYLSSISESFLFHETLVPSPAKSQPVAVKVAVREHWLESDALVTGRELLGPKAWASFFCCGVFNRSPERFRDSAQIPWLVTGTGLNPGLAD